jgi:uncharacterized protein
MGPGQRRQLNFTIPDQNKCGLNSGEKEFSMTINTELLDILVCPKCKGEVRLTEDEKGLACDQCRLLYEIRDEIPIMLIDEAKPLA